MIDIEAVVNLHREGKLATASLRSAAVAVAQARAAGFSTRLSLILDRSDSVTLELAQQWAQDQNARLFPVDFGDLAHSRNHAVNESDATYIGFLDGDDLWSPNWLTESIRFCKDQGDKTICHPAWNVIFGSKQMLFPHPDQLDRKFSMAGLKVANYWTALSFSRRETYQAFPYKPNRLDLGFGFEDWSWNLLTIESGYFHRVVPGTSHFIRYKESDSLREQTYAMGCLRTPHSATRNPAASASRTRYRSA